MARKKTSDERDREVMSGSPFEGVAPQAVEAPVEQAAPEVAPAQVPETEDFSFGGHTFQIPKALAEGIRTERATYDSQLRELKAPRAEPQAPLQAPQVPADDYDYATMLFTKPQEALERFGKRIREDTLREFAPVRQKVEAYEQKQALDRFWGDFYKDHKDLQGDELIVEAVASRHLAELSQLDTGMARSRLADLSRQALMTTIKKHGGKPTATLGRATVESGAGLTTPRQTAAEVEAEEGPRSLSHILKQRREARRTHGQKSVH